MQPIVIASGQAWKLTSGLAALPLAAAGFFFYGGWGPVASLWLGSVVAMLPMGWAVGSTRCPRCHDRWLWTQATTGKEPTLRPVASAVACPACGMTGADMLAARRTARP